MQLTDSTFERALKRSDTPVLLFFTSQACGPSYALQLLVDDLAPEIEKTYEIAEIDIENNPTITRQFQIKGVPTLMVVRKGEPVASRIGTQSEDQLMDWLEECCAKVG